MHHLVFGINFRIHFVSLASLVSIHILIRQHILLIISTFSIHSSFTLPLQAQNVPFQQILPTLVDFFYPLDCLHDNVTGPDIMLISLFLEFCT